MSLKFWSILFTFVFGLLGIGQLHDYVVTGKTPADFDKAPKILRSIVESHDRVNAKRLVEAAAYADAAGQYAVIPGNIKRTIERLTGRYDRDPGDNSPVQVSVAGLTDSECLRAARFLVFKGDILALREEPPPAKPDDADHARLLASQKARITISRPLGTNSRFGI